MIRKNLLVFVVSILFVVSMSACSKKTEPPPTDPEPVEIAPEPEPEPEPEPVIEEEPVETEKVPVLDDIFFEFDKSDLTPDSRQTLDSNARQLKDAESVNIVIEGHCDERGTTSYNLALGERRARATMEYLKSLGIPGSRIDIISYGEERPFDSGHDEDAWAKNRRAHFVIKSS